jgi:hypothetical protein
MTFKKNIVNQGQVIEFCLNCFIFDINGQISFMLGQSNNNDNMASFNDASNTLII